MVNRLRLKQPDPLMIQVQLLYCILLYYKNLPSLLAFPWEQIDNLPWNLGDVRFMPLADAQKHKATSLRDPSSLPGWEFSNHY